MLRFTHAGADAPFALAAVLDAFIDPLPSVLPLGLDDSEEVDETGAFEDGTDGMALSLTEEGYFLIMTTGGGSGLASFAPLKANSDFWRSGVGTGLNESIGTKEMGKMVVGGRDRRDETKK